MEASQLIAEIETILKEAVKVDRMTPNRELALLRCKSGWPNYIHSPDERREWNDPEEVKVLPNKDQINSYEKAATIINLLSKSRSRRIVTGKKIIWLRACGLSYRQIAFSTGVSPKTCENWYKWDMRIIARKYNRDFF